MTTVLENQLHKRRKHGSLRELQTTKNLIDFASNDYLGLARNKTLAGSIFNEMEKHCHFNCFGSTGSRLLTGNTTYAQELEEAIARFHGYEAALLFNCGYMANVGLLSTIARKEDIILFDSFIHASTADGIRLSRAQSFPFRHHDLEHLECRLQKCTKNGRCFVCVESIYSTDGSQSRLREIWQLAKKHEAHLIVDEAHATGVIGPRGRGLVAQEGLMQEVFAQIVTFGKALGCYGAVVLGRQTLKQALINFATSFVYTTALPFCTLAAIQCSYELFPKLEKERQHLRSLIKIFQNAGFNDSETPIQSILIPGGNFETKRMAKKLEEAGFDVRPLLSPTVQQGHEILRICLHSFNTETQLTLLLQQLKVQRQDIHD